MVWLRMDDNMLDHPKWRRAFRLGGDAVLAVWFRLNSWCARNLTDGAIPSDMVTEVAQTRGDRVRRRALDGLVASGLLTRDEHGACVLTDYLERNPSRVQVIAERERKAESERSRRLATTVAKHGPAGKTGRAAVPSHPIPIPSHPQESVRQIEQPEVPGLVLVASVGVADAPAPAQAEMADVRDVFAEWQRVHGHDSAKLDTKRTARIRGALKLHDAQQLKLAIRGALKDDWLMGRDPKSPRRYDGLETLLRDNAQIERLIDLERGVGKRPRRYGSAQPNLGKTGFESLKEHDES